MRLLTRTALAIGILLAARSVPFLGQVMALVGSFLTISVSVTFPPLCHQVGVEVEMEEGGLWVRGIGCGGFGVEDLREWHGRWMQLTGKPGHSLQSTHMLPRRLC